MADAVRTSLGPRGMDKMVREKGGEGNDDDAFGSDDDGKKRKTIGPAPLQNVLSQPRQQHHLRKKKTQLSPGLPAQRRGRHHQRRRHHPEQDDRHAARGQDARRARPLAGRGGGRRHDLRDCESLSFSFFFFFLSAFCAHFRPFF